MVDVRQPLKDMAALLYNTLSYIDGSILEVPLEAYLEGLNWRVPLKGGISGLVFVYDCRDDQQKSKTTNQIY